MRVWERTAAPFALGLLLSGALWAQTPNVDSIMSQVAAHQDQAEQLRARYTYTQKVRIRAIHSNGKLSREESCVYNVIPNDKGTKKDLAQCRGRYESKGQFVEYHKSGESNPDRKIDIDA